MKVFKTLMIRFVLGLIVSVAFLDPGVVVLLRVSCRAGCGGPLKT